MSNLHVILTVIAVAIGYLLGRRENQTVALESKLDDIHAALRELTISLCGDRKFEGSYEMTNEAGATLSEEQLAYRGWGGCLGKVERAVEGLAGVVAQLANKSGQ